MAWNRQLCNVFLWLLMASIADGKHPYEVKGLRYATTNMGKEFFVAIPHNNQYGRPIAQLTFSTFEQLVKINISVPLSLKCKDFGYAESQFTLIDRMPFTYEVTEVHRIYAAGKGYTILIHTSAPVSLLLMVASPTACKDMVMLPPPEMMGWEYYLYTDLFPSWMLFISAFDDNKIIFSLAETSPPYNVFCGLDDRCLSGRMYDLTLDKGQFYYMYTGNPDDSSSHATLTGTVVKATKPVLILNGNILSVSANNKKYQRFSMNVARPYASWGLSYVLMVSPRKNRNLLLKLVTQDPENRGTVYSRNLATDFQFARGNKIYQVDVDKSANTFYYSITTVKPVMAIMICTELLSQAGLLLSFIPTELFTNLVVFKVPDTKPPMPTFSMSVIVPEGKETEMVMNGAIMTGSWITLSFHRGFVYRELDLATTSVSLFNKDPLVRFGVYLFLFKVDYTLISDMGMRYVPRKVPDCFVQDRMAPGDMVDNDCDGRYDEDRWNGQDVDQDGLKDEDVVAETQDGSWGNWQPWFCNANCGERGGNERHRACDDPPPNRGGDDCQGPSMQIGEGCTGFGMLCPKECPPGRFSYTCEAECPIGCAFQKCERENGSCYDCVRGYRRSLYCQYKGENFDAFEESERGFFSKLISFDLGWQYYLFIPIVLTLILAVVAYFIGQRWKKQRMERELQNEKDLQAEQEQEPEPEGEEADV